jgi:hypothetical protein
LRLFGQPAPVKHPENFVRPTRSVLDYIGHNSPPTTFLADLDFSQSFLGYLLFVFWLDLLAIFLAPRSEDGSLENCFIVSSD